jgi:hypothetical protein
MKIYEVVYSGPEHYDGTDIAFLVRAPNFLAAVDEVRSNGDWELREKMARTVHEIGKELVVKDDRDDGRMNTTCILRRYHVTAYNRGWKRWDRKFVGSDYVDEWEQCG